MHSLKPGAAPSLDRPRGLLRARRSRALLFESRRSRLAVLALERNQIDRNPVRAPRAETSMLASIARWPLCSTQARSARSRSGRRSRSTPQQKRRARRRKLRQIVPFYSLDADPLQNPFQHVKIVRRGLAVSGRGTSHHPLALRDDHRNRQSGRRRSRPPAAKGASVAESMGVLGCGRSSEKKIELVAQRQHPVRFRGTACIDRELPDRNQPGKEAAGSCWSRPCASRTHSDSVCAARIGTQ